MANHKATGKTAKRGSELVQRCRAAVLNALDVVEQEGKTISELLAKEFESNPIKFMELASKFCPKDIQAEITHTVNANQLTDDELASIATGSSKRASKAKDSEKQLH